MALKIITADERIERQGGIKGQIWGVFGIGKTTLAMTLDPAKTLFVDMEAGMKAIQGFKGRSVRVRTWPDCRDVACWVGGPNPALRDDQPYSQAHYDYVVSQYGPWPEDIEILFVDSTSNAGRYCLQWAEGQPQSYSEKTGKKDMRGAYGLLGREIVAWAEQLQHVEGLSVWLVGGIEEGVDDFNRQTWKPMLDGSKGANAIPYIFDQVITMAEFSLEDGTKYRGLVCWKDNPWGYPAKDRSGRLALVEEPHLGKLMAKISNTDIGRREIVHTIPTEPVKENPTETGIAA